MTTNQMEIIDQIENDETIKQKENNAQYMLVEDQSKFDLGHYLSRFKSDSVIEKKQEVESKATFYEVAELVRQYFKDKYEESDDQVGNERIRLRYQAIIGEPLAQMIYFDEIEDFLRKKNLLDTPYPDYYPGLAEGIFHHLYGLGPFIKWWDYPESQKARIKGTNILFEIDGKIQLQDFKFESINRVEQLIRALTLKEGTPPINSNNPRGEIDMFDGRRVSVLIPPRVDVPVITFRNYPMKKFSWDFLASKKLKTIGAEALLFYKYFSKIKPRTVISGPVGSGKNTLLEVIFSEWEKDLIVVSVQKTHIETDLSKDFPDRSPWITQMIVNDETDMNEVMPDVLRQDLQALIIPETRSWEAELVMFAAERANTTFLSTFHDPNPRNIPGSFAREILKIRPYYSYKDQLWRAAQNIDIVITMDELEDMRYKRLTGVYEIRFDPFTMQISIHQIVQYDYDTDSWNYKCDFSEDLIQRLSRKNKVNTMKMIDELKRLEALYPIQGDNVFYPPKEV